MVCNASFFLSSFILKSHVPFEAQLRRGFLPIFPVCVSPVLRRWCALSHTWLWIGPFLARACGLQLPEGTATLYFPFVLLSIGTPP